MGFQGGRHWNCDLENRVRQRLPGPLAKRHQEVCLDTFWSFMWGEGVGKGGGQRMPLVF